MYLFHYYIIGMWESNIKFNPINDVWFFSFTFSGFVLFVIIASAIWHVLFEAPFRSAWAEVFKMITLAMSPPRKSEQKMAEQKPMTVNGEEKPIEVDQTIELQPRERAETEKEQLMQAADGRFSILIHSSKLLKKF